MEFCPFCSNCLILDGITTNQTYFACRTCPYKYNIKQRIEKVKKLKGKNHVEI